jgi:DNA-binding XRE family transcriptional regulator
MNFAKKQAGRPQGTMLGRHLKQWRAEMEWSMPRAAKELGLTTQAYINMEEGSGGRRATDGSYYVPRYIGLACLALRAKLAPLITTNPRPVGRPRKEDD